MNEIKIKIMLTLFYYNDTTMNYIQLMNFICIKQY